MALIVPGTAAIAFSTRSTQEAQVMPSMGNSKLDPEVMVSVDILQSFHFDCHSIWGFQRW